MGVCIPGPRSLSPDGTQARLDELQKELIKKANRKEEYDAIADEIFRLRDEKAKAEADTRTQEEAKKRVRELQSFIRKQTTDITEFDESLVRKLIRQITVYENRFTVEFKSDLTVDINK